MAGFLWGVAASAVFADTEAPSRVESPLDGTSRVSLLSRSDGAGTGTGSSGFGFRRWSSSPSLGFDGVSVTSRFDGPAMSGSNEGVGDGLLNLRFRLPLGSRSFFQSQSIFDGRPMGLHGGGIRQVLGYGVRLIDGDSLKFDVVPGVFRNREEEEFEPEDSRWSGNLNQTLSWVIAEGFAVSQNLNTFVRQSDDDVFSAVMNLDLETLVSDHLSFRVSYEVLYEDSASEDLERRDSRFTTSVGYRF